MYSFKYNQQAATLYIILYYCQCSECFGQFLRPSSGAQELYTQHLVCAHITTFTVVGAVDVAPCNFITVTSDKSHNELKVFTCVAMSLHLPPSNPVYPSKLRYHLTLY